MKKILPQNVKIWDSIMGTWRRVALMCNDTVYKNQYSAFFRKVDTEFHNTDIPFNIPSIHNMNRLGVEIISWAGDNQFYHGQNDERTVYFQSNFWHDDIPEYHMHYKDFKLSEFAALRAIEPVKKHWANYDGEITVKGFKHAEFDEALRKKCTIEVKNYAVIKPNEIPVKKRNFLPKVKNRKQNKNPLFDNFDPFEFKVAFSSVPRLIAEDLDFGNTFKLFGE